MRLVKPVLLAIVVGGSGASLTSNVTEGRQDCVTGFDPVTLEIPASGGGVDFTILTSSPTCSWTWNGPLNTVWLHFPFPGFGTGSQTVSFRDAQPNDALTPRSLQQDFGGLQLTVNQPGSPCTLILAPPEIPLPANGGTSSFTVDASNLPCSYSAQPLNPAHGITFVSAESGSAFPATVTFSIGPNTLQGQRLSDILVSANGGFGFMTPRIRIVQNGPPVMTDAPPGPLVFAVHRRVTGPPFMSPPEPLLLSNAENASASWTATTVAPWLVVSPESGAGSGFTTLSLNPVAIVGLGVGNHTATVDIASSVAPLSPRLVNVILRITSTPGSINSAPIGVLDTPSAGATGLSGAIPVTGWALDEVGITRILIYRASVAGEPPGNVYIGDATRVRGVRPDVAASQPNLPEVRSGGWGLMVLSNMLPNGGNGPFTFRAYVDDAQGIQGVLLGEKTATFDNANAVKPFGTIDFPGQGGTVSGTIVAEGWVLAQPHPGRFVPFDGSTIRLFIDNVEQPASATYGIARPDVAALFPPASYANANGPGVRFTIDTTQLADGLHTIAWVVTDSLGAAEGIGSRFFTVQNGGS